MKIKVVNFKLSKSSLSYNANRNKESYITSYCYKIIIIKALVQSFYLKYLLFYYKHYQKL